MKSTRQRLLFGLLAWILPLAFAQANETQAEYSHEWTMVVPDGETSCALGMPYVFWVREGNPKKLLVYFQGGFMCWDAASCRYGAPYKSSINPVTEDPYGQPGIIDTQEPNNPFADYTMVYVPYCTGDLHWGDKVVTYELPSGEPFTVHHKGFVNASTAYAWAYEHAPDPDTVLVTGCSAGGAGSILHAPYLIRQYPNARVVHVSDSSLVLSDQPLDFERLYSAQANIPEWLPEFSDFDASSFTVTQFHIAVANAHPDVDFVQFHFQDDRYWEETGLPFREVRDQHLHEIEQATENFIGVVSEGRKHCILPDLAFSTLEVNGQRFAELLAELANQPDGEQP